MTTPWKRKRGYTELAARNEFLEALEDEGLKRQPLTWREDAEVPADIEKRLDDLSLLSQFVALRELHALIRDDAESPERLSALARAYANLGMLTEHVWTSSTKALTGRALLYAERLYAKEPGAAASSWCRGYVRCICRATAHGDPRFQLCGRIIREVGGFASALGGASRCVVPVRRQNFEYRR